MVHPVSQWQFLIADRVPLLVFAAAWLAMYRRLRWAPLVAAFAYVAARALFFFAVASDAGYGYAASGRGAVVAAAHGYIDALSLVVLVGVVIVLVVSSDRVSRRLPICRVIHRDATRGLMRCFGVLFAIPVVAASIGGIWYRQLWQHIFAGVLGMAVPLAFDLALGRRYDDKLAEKVGKYIPVGSARASFAVSLLLVGGLPALVSQTLLTWLPRQGLYPQTPLAAALTGHSGQLREIVAVGVPFLAASAFAVAAILPVLHSERSVSQAAKRALSYIEVIVFSGVTAVAWWSTAGLQGSAFVTAGMVSAFLSAILLGSEATRTALNRSALTT